MLQADFHMHTFYSNCGMHTHLEMIDEARKRGLKGIALTDHGEAVGGRGVSLAFLTRFRCPYEDFVVWRGIEGNLCEDGSTDIPHHFLEKLDIILLGLHTPAISLGKSSKHYTKLLIECLEKNPFIDIIVHPDIRFFPLDINELVEYASKNNIALELDNANLVRGKTDQKQMRKMVDAILQTQCKCVISSDAHTMNEIGLDDSIRNILKEWEIKDLNIINDHFEKCLEFVKERRQRRKEWIKKIRC